MITQEVKDINAFAEAEFARAFRAMPGNNEVERMHSNQTLLEFVGNIKTVAYQANMQNRKVDLKNSERVSAAGITNPQVSDQEYNRSKSAVADLGRVMRQVDEPHNSPRTEKGMLAVIDRLERDVFRLATKETKQVIKEELLTFAEQQKKGSRQTSGQNR